MRSSSCASPPKATPPRRAREILGDVPAQAQAQQQVVVLADAIRRRARVVQPEAALVVEHAEPDLHRLGDSIRHLGGGRSTALAGMAPTRAAQRSAAASSGSPTA